MKKIRAICHQIQNFEYLELFYYELSHILSSIPAKSQLSFHNFRAETSSTAFLTILLTRLQFLKSIYIYN